MSPLQMSQVSLACLYKEHHKAQTGGKPRGSCSSEILVWAPAQELSPIGPHCRGPSGPGFAQGDARN